MSRFLLKYQTVFKVEEQYLANMSTSLSTTVAPTKTTRKVTKKSTLKSAKSQNIETISVDFNNSILDGLESSYPPKVTKKKLSGAVTISSMSSSTTTETKTSASIKEPTEVLQNENVAAVESKQELATDNGKKKARSKKSRKGETDHENISVVSWRALTINLKLNFSLFNKFDFILFFF